MALLNSAGKVYVGTVLATAVYAGTTKVWPPAPPKPVVSGGVLSSDATYYYRDFTTPGEGHVLRVEVAPLECDYLLVGGGGRGRNGAADAYPSAQVYGIAGGGGGAGGVVTGSITLAPNDYPLAVATGKGTSGIWQSMAFGLTAYVGGDGASNTSPGSIGGSGGGGGYHTSARSGGPAAAGGAQGHPGGNYLGGNGYEAAGGGGWKSAGGDANYKGGSGGAGGTVLGLTVGGGGGGGDGFTTFGNGGVGGGGNGASYYGPATPGAPNTGGGGGGGFEPSRPGANGGSGIIRIRYLRSAVE